jgi:hypothetical protein
MALSNATCQPEFMAVLGLLPPYSLDDLKAAYRAKAMEMHPDRGGSKTDFNRLHEAHERALEYLHFVGDRRKWIAMQVERHLRQQEVTSEVERLGGHTELEEVEWMKDSVGDFAHLADRLRAIRLSGTAADDGFLIFLAEKPTRVPYLITLDVARTRITDNGLLALTGFDLLRSLDLSGTRITGSRVEVAIRSLPSLSRVGLAGSGVGCLSRLRVKAKLRQRELEEKRLRLLTLTS